MTGTFPSIQSLHRVNVFVFYEDAKRTNRLHVLELINLIQTVIFEIAYDDDV